MRGQVHDFCGQNWKMEPGLFSRLFDLAACRHLFMEFDYQNFWTYMKAVFGSMIFRGVCGVITKRLIRINGFGKLWKVKGIPTFSPPKMQDSNTADR